MAERGGRVTISLAGPPQPPESPSAAAGQQALRRTRDGGAAMTVGGGRRDTLGPGTPRVPQRLSTSHHTRPGPYKHMARKARIGASEKAPHITSHGSATQVQSRAETTAAERTHGIDDQRLEQRRAGIQPATAFTPRLPMYGTGSGPCAQSPPASRLAAASPGQPVPHPAPDPPR
jgi:hypothetical protein